MNTDLEDFAVAVAQNDRTRAAAHEWLRAFHDKPVHECRDILNRFARDVKISPHDFGRAWTRLHPTTHGCTQCDGTGLIWNDTDDRYNRCNCDEGQRMGELMNTIAGNNEMLRPAWARPELRILRGGNHQ
jgi:hypothetical protein